MISATKHITVEDMRKRIERMQANKAEYQKALRTGYYCGKRLTSEDREYLRDEIDDLEIYIRQDTWKISGQAEYWREMGQKASQASRGVA